MEIRIDRIEKDLEAINSFTATPGKGITRFTFSQEYMRARDYVIAELKKIGAQVSTTVGGNLRGALKEERKGVPRSWSAPILTACFREGDLMVWQAWFARWRRRG